MKTTVYNYSGSAASIGSFSVPEGGPFMVPEISGVETDSVLVQPGGVLYEIDLEPDLWGAYWDGWGFGLTLAGVGLMLWLVKLLRAAR